MNSTDDLNKSKVDYFKNHAQRKITEKAYTVVRGSFTDLHQQRKIRVHRRNINAIHELSSETKTSNFKIEKLDNKRNDLLLKRTNYIQKNPNLKTSLNHLDTRTNSVIKNRKSRKIKISRQPDSLLNRAKATNISFDSDRENGKQKKVSSNSNRKNFAIKKVAFDNGRKFYLQKKEEPINSQQKNITRKKIQSETEKERLKIQKQRRIAFSSPLTSNSVGERNLAQKVITSPNKAISSAGRSLKESYNKEIEESNMEGLKFANNAISPLARTVRFETTSFVSKKVGFDKKAFNLQKTEKKIMKADKKVFKIKKAQRKVIRRRAALNAKSTILAQKAGNSKMLNHGKNIASKGLNQIKDQALKAVKAIMAKIATSKFLIAGSGLLIAVIVPLIISLPVVMVAGMTTISGSEEEQSLDLLAGSLSPDVLQHEEKVVEELTKYGLEKYKDLILVIIHLESGGTLPDVMQSSESIGLPPNSITDPNRSIEVGIKHFAKGIEQMNSYGVDIQTLIQAYNFGNGFISFVASNGGKWSQELSNQFSSQQANKLGWSSYGNPNYVTKAMQFLTIEGDSASLNLSFDLEGQKLPYPVPNNTTISSPYGPRTHPVYGTPNTFHTGVDFPAPYGSPIISVADGIITKTVNVDNGGYGLYVMVDHGSGVVTLYAHNSKNNVTVGQTVKAGDVIGFIGTTGTSTGNHLHFEVRKDGNYTDPANWLN